jgi:hypothetical protein
VNDEEGVTAVQAIHSEFFCASTAK